MIAQRRALRWRALHCIALHCIAWLRILLATLLKTGRRAHYRYRATLGVGMLFRTLCVLIRNR
ncbi:hypothetical protein PSE10C_06750 [Pseudomonas amygdali pv. eriobotryae]|nr:hypothetical protein PSE10C_06750 [Pseudomonas amygdali pv. eriobotryae]